jgi:hypothetical protein
MEKQITFRRVGYGQWTASTIYYNKEIFMHFTDSQTYDLIKSKDRGYKSATKKLHSKIIRNHKSI